MDKELGDNLSAKDFGMHNDYSFQFDEHRNKKVVVTRQEYIQPNLPKISKEGIVLGIKTANIATGMLALSAASELDGVGTVNLGNI